MSRRPPKVRVCDECKTRNDVHPNVLACTACGRSLQNVKPTPAAASVVHAGRCGTSDPPCDDNTNEDPDGAEDDAGKAVHARGREKSSKMVVGDSDSSDGEAGDDKAGAGDDLGGSANGAGGKVPAKTGGGDGGGAGGNVPANTRIAGGDGRRSPSPRDKKSTWDPRFARFDDDGAPPEDGLLNGGVAGSNSTAAPAAAGVGGGVGAPQNKLTPSGGSTSSHRVAAQKTPRRGGGRTEGSGGDGDRHGNGKTTPSLEGSAAKKSKPDAPAVAGGKRPIAGAGAVGGGGGGGGTGQGREGVDPFSLNFDSDPEELAAVAADVGKDRARKVSAPISPVNRVAPVAPPVAPEAGAGGDWAWNWSDLKQAGWNLCGGDLTSDNFYLRPGTKKSTGVMGITMFRDHASVEAHVRAHGVGGDGGDGGSRPKKQRRGGKDGKADPKDTGASMAGAEGGHGERSGDDHFYDTFRVEAGASSMAGAAVGGNSGTTRRSAGASGATGDGGHRTLRMSASELSAMQDLQDSGRAHVAARNNKKAGSQHSEPTGLHTLGRGRVGQGRGRGGSGGGGGRGGGGGLLDSSERRQGPTGRVPTTLANGTSVRSSQPAANRGAPGAAASATAVRSTPPLTLSPQAVGTGGNLSVAGVAGGDSGLNCPPSLLGSKAFQCKHCFFESFSQGEVRGPFSGHKPTCERHGKAGRGAVDAGGTLVATTGVGGMGGIGGIDGMAAMGGPDNGGGGGGGGGAGGSGGGGGGGDVGQTPAALDCGGLLPPNGGGALPAPGSVSAIVRKVSWC
jgi:hypothetical protein